LILNYLFFKQRDIILFLFFLFLKIFHRSHYSIIPTKISLFIAFARSLDVITDPLMSFITDSCRSKHGRRRPFILTGCIPYGIFLFLLCSPPDGMSSWRTSQWFGGFYILYYIMNTYSNIPYDALGPELTDNYDDRSRLFFISGLFDGFGTILTVTTPVGLQLMLEWNSIFDSPNCNTIGIFGNATNMTIIDGATINTEGCSPYEPIGGIQRWSSSIAAYNRSLYVPNVCVQNDDGIIDSQFINYCTCRDACKQAFSFGHERTAFTIVGAGFAIWYIVTSIICVCCIKERGQIDGGASLSTPPPLVRELFKATLFVNEY
jgi:hypothetical protein